MQPVKHEEYYEMGQMPSDPIQDPLNPKNIFFKFPEPYPSHRISILETPDSKPQLLMSKNVDVVSGTLHEFYLESPEMIEEIKRND